MPTTTVGGKIVRVALNQSSDDSVKDKWSEEPIVFWQGGTAKLQCGLFKDDPSADTIVNDFTNVVSAILYIRANSPRGTVLVSKTVLANGIDSTLTYTNWLNDSASHFTFSLTEADTNQAVSASGTLPIYWVVKITTTTNTYVAGFGYGRIVDVGIQSLATPTSSGFTGLYVDSGGTIQSTQSVFFQHGMMGGSWSGFIGTNAGEQPPAHNGQNPLIAFGSNMSGSNAEANIFNTSIEADGFRFSQKTGVSTFRDVAWLRGVGRLDLTPKVNNQALNIVQSWTGTSAIPSNYGFNDIQVTDSYDAGGAGVFMAVLNIGHTLTGSGMKGSRGSLQVTLNKQYPLVNEGNDSLAAILQTKITGNSGGTLATPRGGGTAFTAFVDLDTTPGVYYGGINVAEINIAARTGTLLRDKVMFSMVNGPNDGAQGYRIDAPFLFTSQGGPGWKNIFLFSDTSNTHCFDASCKLLAYLGINSVTKPTIFRGIDLSGFDVTDALMNGTYSSLSEFGMFLGAGSTATTTSLTARGGATNVDLELHAQGTGKTLIAGNCQVTNTLIASLGTRLDHLTASQFVTTDGSKYLISRDAAGMRSDLGLGSLATQSGTFSGTSSGVNTGDQDLSGYQLKSGTLALGGFGSITGTLPIANVPTGTTGTTVALGNHTHTGVYQPADGDLDTWATITPATGIGTFLGTPSSANLKAAITDETGTGALVFATSPTLVTPDIGVATATSLNGVTINNNALTTYTPTVTTDAGALSSYTITGRWKQLGKLVYFKVKLIITTDGTTGATYISISLPTNATTDIWSIPGREYQNTGKVINGHIGSGTQGSVFLRYYDNTYPGANGNSFVLSGWYEIP